MVACLIQWHWLYYASTVQVTPYAIIFFLLSSVLLGLCFRLWCGDFGQWLWASTNYSRGQTWQHSSGMCGLLTTGWTGKISTTNHFCVMWCVFCYVWLEVISFSTTIFSWNAYQVYLTALSTLLLTVPLLCIPVFYSVFCKQNTETLSWVLYSLL